MTDEFRDKNSFLGRMEESRVNKVVITRCRPNWLESLAAQPNTVRISTKTARDVER